jgi:hypothetical protein
MTDEQKAAFVIAQAACAMAEIAGMQATNQQRAHVGMAPAYDEQHFQAVITNNVIGHNSVLTLFQN